MKLTAQTGQKDELELAEKCISADKKIWKLHKDKDGFRPRRLVIYCDIKRIPKNPKIDDVLDTAYFVMSYAPVKPDKEIKKELKQKVEELEALVEKIIL
ncbi:MAG: hypothetical protein GY795_10410 [Desulfobacterales bacterium]|nr:hypothetical protein [Desulfobacterales bacterium]